MNSPELTADISGQVRDLYIVLGDQLNHDSLLWQDFDPELDIVWMAEVADESTETPSSLTRTLLFFSSMRHFAAELITKGTRLIYCDINYTRQHALSGFQQALSHSLNSLAETDSSPESLRVVLPGDSRIRSLLADTAESVDIPLTITPDNHFLAEPGEFKDWLDGRKVPIMEHWYRKIRKRLGLLMSPEGKPIGGEWNFDKLNRKSFSKSGPELTSEPTEFELNDLSQNAVVDVAKHFELSGENALEFWPVNREQALLILNEFIEHKLPHFGDYQDAMWTEDPWLFHARISSALNLKLLHPAEVCHAAEAAYHSGHAPINAVEGFIRQIAGWREYIRGLYWSHHADWLDFNHLDAQADLPDFYWTANTDMNCLHHSVKQVLDYGYGHHIQRLMVTGLFALLYGVEPRQIHAWYLAMYVDAVAWVEVPNTLGMSQFADGGIVGTKPYIASGAYINRMSNYCSGCPYDPKQAMGPKACPFTALYWQFIDTHQQLIGENHRLRMQLNNWLRKSESDQSDILATAQEIRVTLVGDNPTEHT